MKALYLLFVPASAFLVPQLGCRRPLLLLKAASSDDDKEDILDLYKTVAEQDPEWYQEFIANVLQEDVLLDSCTSNESSADATSTTTKVNGDASSYMLSSSSEPATARKETKEPETVPVEAAKINIVGEEEVVVDEVIEEAGKVAEAQLTYAATDDTQDSDTGGAGAVDPTNGHDIGDGEDLRTHFSNREDSDAGDVQYISSDDLNDEQDDEALQEQLATISCELEEEDDILSNEDIDFMVESTMQQAEKEIQEAPSIVQEEAPTAVANSTASDEGAAIGDAHSNAAPPTVVVYRDLYTGYLLAAPLRALTKLGYTLDEVSFLQPDALSLILEDNIAKPRRGVPQQWKVSPSQKSILNDVHIVTKEQAKNMLAAAKAKRPPLPIVEEEEALAEEDLEEVPRRSRRQRPPNAQDPEGRQQVRRGEDRQRKPRSSRQPQEQRSRTGRNQKEPPSIDLRGDPPMPVNPVWVDIDTFRDLLRKEAELRVRILGDGWKGTVKKESKWRLDLYKEWLWSLSEGVGDPIVVESRVPPSQRRAREIPTSSQSRRRSYPNSASRREDAPSRQRLQRRRADPPSSRAAERGIMNPRNPSRSRRSEGLPRPVARPQRRRQEEEDNDDEYYYD